MGNHLGPICTAGFPLDITIHVHYSLENFIFVSSAKKTILKKYRGPPRYFLTIWI